MAALMQQSVDTYASVGISTSYSADNRYEARINLHCYFISVQDHDVLERIY
jgi:hypothetical protein